MRDLSPFMDFGTWSRLPLQTQGKPRDVYSNRLKLNDLSSCVTGCKVQHGPWSKARSLVLFSFLRVSSWVTVSQCLVDFSCQASIIKHYATGPKSSPACLIFDVQFRAKFIYEATSHYSICSRNGIYSFMGTSCSTNSIALQGKPLENLKIFAIKLSQ